MPEKAQDYNPGAALDRFFRNLIFLHKATNEGTEVSGINRYDKDNRIEIYPEASANFRSINDVIKHELVHTILPSRLYATPFPDDYTGFRTPPANSLAEKLFIAPAFQSGPNNLWNFNDWGRAGHPIDELPAYMSVYNPSEAKGISLNQRNMYMEDLFKFLASKGGRSTERGELLKKLLSGDREFNPPLKVKDAQ